MIRVRHPNGTSTFKLESTLSDLHQLVHPDIQPQDLDLKTGYPPRSINLTSVPPTTTLNSPPFSLSKGEQILLAKKSGSSRSQSSSDNNNGTSNSTQQPIKSSTTSNGTHPTTSSTTNSKAPSKISKGSTPKDGEVFVEVDGSFLTLKVVPDDNSCMFNSVNFAFEQKIGTEACLKLRKGECLCLPLVVDAIRSNPIDYSDAMIGQSRDAYMKKMMDPKTWGGAIELSILCKHFKTQIISIDVGSGMVNHFGEEEGFENSIIVVYSGIHYDALCLLPTPDAPAEFGTTVFSSHDSRILSAAKQLCSDLKQRHYYTDTATFTLKCNTCKTNLEGEKSATEHAMKTGHTDFGEY